MKALLPPSSVLDKKFPEWQDYQALLQAAGPFAKVFHHGFSSPSKDQFVFPIESFSVGAIHKTAPTLWITAGVHGLERIGSRVAMSLAKTLLEQLSWDKSLQQKLEKIRIVFTPLVNPTGILDTRRSNGHGVDLMRNAPVQADRSTWLLSGHHLSSALPWFRGYSKLEPENESLKNFFQEELSESETLISLDIHSGFGTQDQIWFPYAKSKKSFFHIPETYLLFRQFERAFPHHFYRIEPQALNYTTHGDLWDYLYDLQRENKKEKVFIPLCLEMGSWTWIRKNPVQLFSALGPFNPLKPHREKRILRRHQTLFDFLLRSLFSEEGWARPSEQQRASALQKALHQWDLESSV